MHINDEADMENVNSFAQANIFHNFVILTTPQHLGKMTEISTNIQTLRVMVKI